jgi:MinD-like ATPase involved in chromosome partitioning or flagellar assembly/FixJ family two-component response regulator
MAERTFHVLLIEDNPGDARLLLEWLSGAGGEFAMEWADNLSKGLEVLERGHIDVVVLDLRLPDSRGFETFARVRKHAPQVPIIVLSGIDDEALAVQAVREGAQDYLVKAEVNAALVVRSIRYAIERQKVQAGVPKTEPQKRARVLGFLGVKGGVGTTSVALNVASVLAQKGHSVTLAELRSYPGTLAHQVHTRPGLDLSSLFELDAVHISEPAVSARLCKLPFGLRVLFGPQKADESKEIGAEQAKAIVEGLACSADFVVLDLPAHASAATRAAVQACDFTLLTLEAEPVSIAAARTTLELMESWGLGRRIIGAAVVNRGLFSNPLTFGEIKSSLPCEIVGVVPPAAEAFLAAHKCGLPVVLSKPESTCAVALTELAARLVMDPVPPLSA